jgi:hypothetical protein
MGGEEVRKVEAIRAIRYLAAILYRLSRVEAALQEHETSEYDVKSQTSAAAPLEVLRLCALARKQLYSVEKIL